MEIPPVFKKSNYNDICWAPRKSFHNFKETNFYTILVDCVSPTRASVAVEPLKHLSDNILYLFMKPIVRIESLLFRSSLVQH